MKNFFKKIFGNPVNFFLKKTLKPIAPMIYTKIYRNLFGWSRKTNSATAFNCKAINISSQNRNKRLFIDCGVNEGVVMLSYWKKLRRNFDFVGFEIQSELIPIAAKAVPDANIFNKAISDENSNVQIFLPKTFAVNYRGGTSIVPGKVKQNDLQEVREIESINFVEYLKNQRKDGYDYIAVKMDIEGMEYRIINKLWENYCKLNENLIDFLIIEFHPDVLDGEKNDKYIDLIGEMNIKLPPFCTNNIPHL